MIQLNKRQEHFCKRQSKVNNQNIKQQRPKENDIKKIKQRTQKITIILKASNK